MSTINFEKYFDSLIGKIFKILPLSEEVPLNDVEKYKESLLIELKGASVNFDHDSYFVAIISKIEGIRGIKDHNVCRKTVLESLNLLKKFKTEYLKKEVKK